MANPIKRSDIYEGGNPFQDVIKSLVELRQELEKLRENMKGGATKNLSDFNKVMVQVEKTTKDYTEANKEAYKQIDKTRESVRNYEKDAATIQQRIAKLQETQKKQDMTTAKGRKNWQNLQTDVRALKKDLRETNKAIDDNIKIQKAQEGSIEQLRAKLARNTAQWNKMSKSQRDNKNIGGALQKQTKAISDELKKLEGAIGDNRRSVGAYSEAMEGVLSRTTIFGVNIGLLKNQLGVYKEALVGVGGALKASATATSGWTKALKILKLALIGTGIGALVVAFGALVTYFTQTQRGMDKLTQAFDGFKAALAVVKDSVSEFGEGLYLIFSGRFKEGADKLKSSFKDVGADIKKEVGQAVDLRKQMQNLEDQEIKLIETRAKKRNQIAELRLASKDENKSYKERIALLDEAIKEEKLLMAEETKLKKERARINNEMVNMGESMRDEIRENAELMAAADEQERISKDRIRTIQSERLSLMKKIGREQQKILDSQKKIIEELVKDATVLDEEVDFNISEAMIKAMNEDYYKNQAEYEEAAGFVLKRFKEDIEEASGKEEFIPTLEDRFFKGLFGIFGDTASEEKIAQFKEQFAKAFEIVNDAIMGNLEQQQAEIDKQISDTQSRVSNLQSKLDEERTKQEEGLANSVNVIQAQLAAETQALEQAQEKREEVALKQARLLKVTTLAQQAGTLGNLLFTASEIFATEGKLGIVGVPLAIAAIATMFGFFKTLSTQAKDLSKFEDGGTWVEGGKRHSEGGNRYGKVETEKGERMSVFSRKATSKYNDMIVDFTNAVNRDNLDLFDLNFRNKFTPPNTVVINYNQLLDVAKESLTQQELTNDYLRRQKIIKGNTEIDINGNKIIYV